MSATVTPETKVIEEMETPIELTLDEMETQRYSYDLPSDNKEGTTDTTPTGFADLNAADDVSSPEEENNSEIPGDPRGPHQTQPPTSEEY